MGCNGVECKRHKALKPTSGGRYAAGQSRCQTCEIYIWWTGTTCPCCGTNLRKKPRAAQYKDLYDKQTEYNIQNDIEAQKNIIEELKANEA